jgi:hypothetical protein
VRLPFTLYVVALVARFLTGSIHPDPAYPDATYYVAVARSLAAGHGFTVDFIWNFVDVGGRLPAVPVLPIPSNAHWMPLASLVQVPFLVLFGTSAWAGMLPFIFVGATVAPLTWAIARDAGLSPSQAIAAGLMGVVPGAINPFLGQPDNFALFMPLGALALWLCARGLRGDARAFALGGLVVGVATLARNDGVLLGIPFALGWARQLWIARRPEHRPPTGDAGGSRPLPFGAALGCAALFLLVMAPWYARQLAVFGALSPSAASGRILWIRNYGELFSVTGDPSLASFLAQGWGPLVTSRIEGFISAAQILTAVPFLLFLVPFLLWGAWARRRSVHFGPWFVYGVAFLLFSGLLSAVHVRYGTFLHSAVALAPHGYVLAVEGIGLAVAWTGRRLRHWEVARATRNFTAIAVAVLWIGGAWATWKATDGWESEANVRRTAAAALAPLARPGDRLMSADPGAYRYYAGLGGVVTPADPLAVIESTARAYEIRWLVLERAHIVDAFAPLYLGTAPLPAWLANVADGPIVDGLPASRVYAVCLDAADPRPACAAPST